MKTLVHNLENGTVIDHIPPEITFHVWNLLGKQHDVVVVGNHLPSKRMGKKGIIKIANKFLSEAEANKITLLAPHATVSVIKEGKVFHKYKLSLPSLLKGVITCINPNCITRHEQRETAFKVIQENPLKVRCLYCELLIHSQEIVLS
ncbi:aspartate carbamoyltransferase regulatory subunit [Candidatus Woesearchaeota archaeon]|nr:aspartate carbamoyltransferase regulatory subunit [Candidatus Woesearchaeota archaeon]